MHAQVTSQRTFRHDAILYAGKDEFCDRMGAFATDGLARGEQVLVMVTADKIDLLRAALGHDAGGISFEDMLAIGRNPARIIPAWRDFFGSAATSGRLARVIGEPIWAERTQDELVESQRHEELINIAFGEATGWLLCPYDTTALDPAVIDEAFHSHPALLTLDGGSQRSETYAGEDHIGRPFDRPLPEPHAVSIQIGFGAETLPRLRRATRRFASVAGLQETAVEELVIAVNEVATNSVRHGGGGGTFRAWHDEREVVCEVSDKGLIKNPLIGRIRPKLGAQSGFGLWLVNQLCDLVQLRVLESGVVVRLHRTR